MKKSSLKTAALLVLAALVMFSVAVWAADCCKRERYVPVNTMSFDVPITDNGTPEIAVYTAESE